MEECVKRRRISWRERHGRWRGFFSRRFDSALKRHAIVTIATKYMFDSISREDEI